MLRFCVGETVEGVSPLGEEGSEERHCKWNVQVSHKCVHTYQTARESPLRKEVFFVGREDRLQASGGPQRVLQVARMVVGSIKSAKRGKFGSEWAMTGGRAEVR